MVTGVETLHPNFEELRKAGIEPELEIMSRLITYFGPISPQTIKHIDDQRWGAILMELSEKTVGDPNMRFDQWTEEVFPNLDAETKRFISRMTKLSPTERATMSQILVDPWWSGLAELGGE